MAALIAGDGLVDASEDRCLKFLINNKSFCEWISS